MVLSMVIVEHGMVLTRLSYLPHACKTTTGQSFLVAWLSLKQKEELFLVLLTIEPAVISLPVVR